MVEVLEKEKVKEEGNQTLSLGRPDSGESSSVFGPWLRALAQAASDLHGGRKRTQLSASSSSTVEGRQNEACYH